MYLYEVNSLTLSSACERAKGRRAVKHAWGRGAKSNPIDNKGSICARSGFEHAYSEIISCHFSCPSYCWVVNADCGCIFVASGCQNTYIWRTRKYPRVLHDAAMKKTLWWPGHIRLSALEEILPWERKKVNFPGGYDTYSPRCYSNKFFSLMSWNCPGSLRGLRSKEVDWNLAMFSTLRLLAKKREDLNATP